MSAPLPRLRRLFARLARDRSGLALLEFAFAAPIVLGIGLYGIEISNLALTNMRVSQAALELADNASRVGLTSGLATVQLREVDLNDVLQATRQQGTSLNLTKYGRITLSSLEESGGVQRIHWQRCLGLKTGTGYDSSYGKTVKTDGVTYDPTAGVDTDTSTADNASTHPGTIVTGGMGETGAKVVAPANSGVMFVEINYQYQPIVGAAWVGAARVHYIASFIVRDFRDFKEVYNPAPAATLMTCDKYTL